MDTQALRAELERSRDDALALVEQLKGHVAQAEALSSRISRIIHQLDQVLDKDRPETTARPARKTRWGQPLDGNAAATKGTDQHSAPPTTLTVPRLSKSSSPVAGEGELEEDPHVKKRRRVSALSFDAPPPSISRVVVESVPPPIVVPRLEGEPVPDYEDAWPYPTPSDTTDTHSHEPRLNPKYWIHYAYSPECSTDESGNPVFHIGNVVEPVLINWKAYRRKEKYDGDLFQWKPNTPERQQLVRESLEELMQAWMRRSRASPEDASAFLSAFPEWVRALDVYPDSVNYSSDIFFASGNLNEIIRWDQPSSCWRHETLPLRPRRPGATGSLPEWNGIVDWDNFNWTLRHVYRLKPPSS